MIIKLVSLELVILELTTWELICMVRIDFMGAPQPGNMARRIGRNTRFDDRGF